MGVERQKTILLVDDEAIIAMTEKMALEKYGYNVRIAPTGEEAVEAVAKTPAIDLVLMDINLGSGIDGTEAAALILRQRDLPVVFLSSHMEPEVVAKTEKITSYGYVVKNSSMTVLDASIKMAFKLFEAKTKEIEKEKALKENGERLRDILFSMGDWVWEVDEHGVYTYSSGKDVGLLGSSAKDIIGKTPFAFMPPDEAKRVAALFAQIVSNKTPIIDLENWKIGRNGERICLLTNGVPILDKEGNLKGYRGVDKDITERKQTQKVLDDLIDKNPMSIQIMDRDGFTLKTNPAFTILFGSDPPSDFSIFAELQNNGFGELILRAKKGEVVHFPDIYYNVHDRYPEQPDKKVCVSAVLFPLTNPAGVIERFVFMHEDITGRKQAEEKLFRSEQNNRAWLENSPACTKIVDLDFNLQYMSSAGIKGLKIDDITPYYGKPYPFHFYPESFKTIMTGNILKAKETGEAITQEAPVVDINGQEICYHSTIVPVKDQNDRVDYLLIVSMDTTERKWAEEQLRESERWTKGIFAALDESVLVVTPDRRLVSTNPAVHHMFGYTNEELSKRSTEILHVDHEHFLEFGRRIQAAFDKGESAHFKFEAKRKNDEIFPTEHCVSLLKDERGEAQGIVSVVRDITARKRAEEEIKRQLAEKEILLKEVHHRIKNNIASIGGLLSLQMQSVTNPQALSVLQDAIGRVDSMRILYDKLLLSEVYKDISVKDYLDDLIDTIIAIFPKNSRIKFEKRIADFHLDAKHLFPLGVIINELLTNIMKYAFSKRKTGLIKISLEKVDNHVTLIVQDNGLGLPAGFNIDESKGFGLKLVAILVKQLAGSLAMEKKAGNRSTVEFDI